MTYILSVNGDEVENFTTEEEVKKHLTEWNWESTQFTVLDEQYEPTACDVDGLFKLLDSKGEVTCTTSCMCEMGDDEVEIELAKR